VKCAEMAVQWFITLGGFWFVIWRVLYFENFVKIFVRDI
jgi:hypothetical protein